MWWHKVDITGVFNDPVVVMGPLSFNGPHPVTIRVKNVTRSSFFFQIQEWSYLDFAHMQETISYMIVEAGVHELYDGTFIQANHTLSNVKSSRANEKKVDFMQPFESAPVVFT